MEIGLLGLPLEIICHILVHLTPHETSQFARTSKKSTKIFKFDITRIIDQLITEWSVFIFCCPRCGKAMRGGSQVSFVILVGNPPQEHIYKTCRLCHYQVRKETMKKLNSLLAEYRADRDHETEYRRMAFNGMCRYQSSGKCPRKKDLDYMQNIVKVLYAV